MNSTSIVQHFLVRHCGQSGRGEFVLAYHLEAEYIFTCVCGTINHDRHQMAGNKQHSPPRQTRRLRRQMALPIRVGVLIRSLRNPGWVWGHTAVIYLHSFIRFICSISRIRPRLRRRLFLSLLQSQWSGCRLKSAFIYLIVHIGYHHVALNQSVNYPLVVIAFPAFFLTNPNMVSCKSGRVAESAGYRSAD